MQILVTIGGLGQRFKQAGDLTPKPIAKVLNKPAINHLLECFDQSWKVICVIAEHFQETEVEKTILQFRPKTKIVYSTYSERGPVDTVLAGIPFLDRNDSVAVSYCDYRMIWDSQSFEDFVMKTNCDVSIPCYRGIHPTYEGPNSYAHLRVDEFTNEVLDIQEKKIFGTRIQDEWTSTGFYYFKSVELLEKGLELQIQKNLKYGNEFYTSLAVKALMNEAHEMKQEIKVLNYEISHFLQMGTPDDIARIEKWQRLVKSEEKGLDSKVYAYWKTVFSEIKA